MTQNEKLWICIEALRELVEPKGAYSLDQLEHATNTIADVSKIATEALHKIGMTVN